MKLKSLFIITILLFPILVFSQMPQGKRRKLHQKQKNEQGIYKKISAATTQQDTSTHKSKFLRKNVLLFSAGIGEDYALCDMSKRFGFNTNASAGFHYYTQSGWLFGLEYNYIFGRDLKGDALHLFDNIKTSNGQIINQYGEYSQYYVAERGFFVGIKIGHTFTPFKLKAHKLLLSSSIGILQHKLYISVDGNNTPQIQGDYAKGYDHLTNGISGRLFVGYAYLPVYSPINFYAGLELYTARTQNRRSINFDTMQPENGARTDCLIGLKIGWFISIYKQDIKKYYYFY